ncbi:hypothetical protein ACYUYC_06585 [Enterococcus faecium]
MTAIYNSVTELIGKTPIVKLNKIVPEDSADVFVKLEFFNRIRQKSPILYRWVMNAVRYEGYRW